METEVNKIEKKKFREKFEKFHDKNYKLLLLIPLILLIFSIGFMTDFYLKNHDILNRDVSLTGGTSITINGNLDAQELKSALSGKLQNLNVREISDISGKQIAVILETKTEGALTKQITEDYLGYNLTGANSSFEFTGATLSQDFYFQLLIAILFSFLFMSIVVFIIFRTLVPSLAVILSAFMDIFMTLTVINLMGVQISTAGIVAFLMLIGYSVDTDILLTNRILKTHESINHGIFRAFKTGIMMTLTSITAVIVAFIILKPYGTVLNQIFVILAIGLCFDIFNTWITNVSILKWYVKRKKNEN